MFKVTDAGQTCYELIAEAMAKVSDADKCVIAGMAAGYAANAERGAQHGDHSRKEK